MRKNFQDNALLELIWRVILIVTNNNFVKGKGDFMIKADCLRLKVFRLSSIVTREIPVGSF